MTCEFRLQGVFCRRKLSVAHSIMQLVFTVFTVRKHVHIMEQRLSKLSSTDFARKAADLDHIQNLSNLKISPGEVSTQVIIIPIIIATLRPLISVSSARRISNGAHR
jgi:hypothetical protein